MQDNNDTLVNMQEFNENSEIVKNSKITCEILFLHFYIYF